jgi:hypothetical protein
MRIDSWAYVVFTDALTKLVTHSLLTASLIREVTPSC